MSLSWNRALRPNGRSVERSSDAPYISINDLIALAAIAVLIILVSWPNLRSQDIDDLDSAHHLMDGYFFRDLLADRPMHLPAYALHYYKQYPALGFLFWPPLFPFVLGLFCLAGGAHVLTARVCIMCFGLVFSFLFYRILRRQCSSWLSFAATAAAIAAPGIAWSFNEVMLELPTLAMMCLAILAYLRFTDRLGESQGFGRALLCATACAAVVYTKQPAWFLYPVLLLNFAVLHSRFIKKPEVLLALAATTLLCVPLALFTFKFGHANLTQSVGNNTQLIMKTYASLPRWSVAAWTFYPKLAASLLGLPVVLLLIGALVLAAVRPLFFRDHLLWFCWIFFAYVTFSYYDNRLSRHATLWWPAWIALAAACLRALEELVPQRLAWSLPLLLLFPVPFEVRQVWHSDLTDYREVQRPIAALFEKGNPGNILAFGQDKQVLIALVREHDQTRTVHVVRGERLLTGKNSLIEICKAYRVGTVLIEVSDAELLGKLSGIEDASSFRPVLESHFIRRGIPIRLLAFHYEGPVDPTMADTPLAKDLL